MAGVQVLLLNDIFLSLNSANSLKTFRKNSIEFDENLFILEKLQSPDATVMQTLLRTKRLPSLNFTVSFVGFIYI